MYTHCGTGPVAAFLHRLTEKHAVSDSEFLVDCGGYLTALFRHELSGQLNYRERNYIGKWFQTVSMRIDRFHSGGAVNRVLAAGYAGLDTTTTIIDRTKH